MLARIVVLFAAQLPIVAGASEDIPDVTRDTLNGVWEGVVGDWSVYRMEIRPSGASYLAQTATKGLVILYRLSAIRVESGHVFLRFERPTNSYASNQREPNYSYPPAIITLEGKGSAG